MYIYIVLYNNPKRSPNTETVECTVEWLVHLCVCIVLLIVLIHYRCLPVLYEYNVVANRDFNDFREDFEKFIAFACHIVQSSDCYCYYFINEHPRKCKGAQLMRKRERLNWRTFYIKQIVRKEIFSKSLKLWVIWNSG